MTIISINDDLYNKDIKYKINPIKYSILLEDSDILDDDIVIIYNKNYKVDTMSISYKDLFGIDNNIIHIKDNGDNIKEFNDILYYLSDKIINKDIEKLIYTSKRIRESFNKRLNIKIIKRPYLSNNFIINIGNYARIETSNMNFFRSIRQNNVFNIFYSNRIVEREKKWKHLQVQTSNI